MNDYKIHCTTEQTKKALELGAPIKKDTLENTSPIEVFNNCVYIIPTAEEMVGWLEDQKNISSIEVSQQYGINKYCYYIFDDYGNDIESSENKIRFASRKEATLAAIDAALDYLIDN